MANAIMMQSPERSEHLDALGELFGKTFTRYWDRYEYSRLGYFDASPYDWESSRIGVSAGQIVSHFGVWGFALRIGRSVTRMAGIGAVATLKTMRGQGLMRTTATACVGSLKDAGYDISLLFGIPGFYHRFGYVVTFPEASFTCSTRELPEPDGEISHEPFTGDVTELADCYNRENETVTGTYVRPTYRKARRPDTAYCRRFDDGYVWVARDGDTLVVIDCAGRPETIVSIVRELAYSEVTPAVCFKFLPRRSRLGEYLQTISHSYTADHRATGGPMMKTINLESLSTKIADELSARLENSALAKYDGSLLIADAEEAVALEIRKGRVESVKRTAVDEADSFDGAILGGHALVRLIMGAGDPERICRQGGIDLRGSAPHLVPVLFPDQEPSTILWDRF
jgi:hypothetical protein